MSGTEPEEIEQHPQACPECDSVYIVGDGNTWECDDCGYSWGTIGGRGNKHFGKRIENGRI